MGEPNLEKVMIPGEFLLRIILWLVELTPEELDQDFRFILALCLSIIAWVGLFRLTLEMLKKALGIGHYHRGGQ